MKTRIAFVVLLAMGRVVALADVPQPVPQVQIVPLGEGPTTGVPVVSWVGAGGKKWQEGPPVFEVANAKSGLKAKGWIAVSAEAILFHVVVTDAVHFHASPNRLYAGDSLQLGIDALGRSAETPPVADAEAEVEALYGKGAKLPKSAVAWRIEAEKRALRSLLEGQNKKPEETLWLQHHMADYCVALVNGKSLACSFYHGQGKTGDKPQLKPAIVRDENARTTTYDFGVPWADIETVAGASGTIRVALFVNDVSKAGEAVEKTFWGGGIGGKFAPFRFNRLAVADPPGSFAAAMVTRSAIGGRGEPAQVAIAVKNDRAARIEATVGRQTAALEVAAAEGEATVKRYAVQVSGLAVGSSPLQVNVRAGGRVVAAAATRVFNDSPEGWYEFTPANDPVAGSIGLQDWVEKPAGKHGFVHVRDGRMVADDGTVLRFWGGSGVGPSNEHPSEKMAAFAEKYGIVGTRQMILNREHAGFGSDRATAEFDAKLLDRFDKHTAALREHGIYYQALLQWIYPVKPGDAPKLLAAQEAMQNGVIGGLENFAPDIQDLRIAAAVNFLTHKNPYTGLTYVEDPALYCLEIQNESDIFWYSTNGAVEKCPTYRAFLCKEFCNWLRARYGSQEKLAAAWGPNGLNAYPQYARDESLEGNTIYPALGAWFFGTVGLKEQQEKRGLGQRLLDTAEFLHETQNKYYQRFEKAVRDVGYKGMMIGSNWQADSGVGHYYNLQSDRLMGVIDRHNYYGGMGMWFLHTGLMNTRSMLDHPGSGLLSTGMQQVGDRPFSMTEWMVEAPAQWQVEGPSLIAAYGMGLQGWSAVYASAIDAVGFTPTVQSAGVFNGNTPAQLALYPALARMVMRGDVKTGPVISSRKISPESLKTGKFDFEEAISQIGDTKDFGGQVPSAALAAGRVLVEYVDKPTPSTFPDLAAALRDKVIVSNTGQLTWYFPGHHQGHFTINTDGTKAVVGFAPDREYALGDVKVRMDNKYGALFVTALEKDSTLATCKSILVTALARARNTGMVYGECTLDRLGRMPVIMEPVSGAVTFSRPVIRAYLLDHDGRRTDQTVPVENGRLLIDGRRDRTPYYEIVPK